MSRLSFISFTLCSCRYYVLFVCHLHVSVFFFFILCYHLYYYFKCLCCLRLLIFYLCKYLFYGVIFILNCCLLICFSKSQKIAKRERSSITSLNHCFYVFWYECSDTFIYIYACIKFYDLDMCVMF